MTIQEILKTYWNHDAFRPMQEDIIQSVLLGYDTLALLPTGGGKSVCFQVTSLMKDGLCVVVTPLIALMQDQVQQLKRKGIPGAFELLIIAGPCLIFLFPIVLFLFASTKISSTV